MQKNRRRKRGPERGWLMSTHVWGTSYSSLMNLSPCFVFTLEDNKKVPSFEGP